MSPERDTEAVKHEPKLVLVCNKDVIYENVFKVKYLQSSVSPKWGDTEGTVKGESRVKNARQCGCPRNWETLKGREISKSHYKHEQAIFLMQHILFKMRPDPFR